MQVSVACLYFKMGITAEMGMCVHGSLPVIGEYLYQLPVDKDPEMQVLSFIQGKVGFCGTDLKCLHMLASLDLQSTFSMLISQEADHKIIGQGGVEH